MDHYCTGKRPARNAVSLRFGSYYNTTTLIAPVVFGKPWLVPNWGMLGNDQVGDCVVAARMHGIIIQAAMRGKPIPVFSNPISVYSAVGASEDPPQPYILGNDSTDNGLDMQQAASYWRKTGITDTAGDTHKLAIYTALDVDRIRNGNFTELELAISLFWSVDLGVQLPQSAESQFDEMIPWTLEHGEKGEDGHCICGIGYNSKSNPYAVTWGRNQGITRPWLSAFIDEGIVSIPEEMATPALLDDFKQITK